MHEINENDKENRLYTDLAFIQISETDSLSIPLVQQGHPYLGGVHSFKPLCQECWEKDVSQAIELAAECQPFISALDGSVWKSDVRPRLQVGTQQALIDMGTAVSICPKSCFENAQKDTLILEAVNKSRFETYGYRMKIIKIGHKS